MILSGFLPYWVHRLSHEHDNFLWRVHSVHHSPERLYWLNALRLHPLNVFWNVYLSLFPLQFLGFGEEVIVTVGILNNIVNIYNHANINFKLGWLNWVFNMSELHRWHHSKAIEEANHNYSAGSLIFWDLVFGTYLHPEQQLLPKHVGLSTDSNYPTRSFYKLLLYPFCRCAG
jgi:sterol desaturase/sphingolipid hydroxylase (fatty acid hydroxylase superfamily)